jgi:HEAT repeat protein
MKLYRTKYGITMPLVVVAAAALLMWAWKYNRDSRPPGIWIRFLEDAKVDHRDMALTELARMGPEAKVAVGPLMRTMMTDSSEFIRANAVRSLVSILKDDPGGPAAAAVASALIEAIKERSPVVRQSAAAALEVLGRDTGAALSALRSALQDPDVWVRGTAVGALVEVACRDGKPHPELYSDVRRGMQTEDEHVRQMAIYAISKLETKSPGLIRKLLGDDDPRVRRCVVELMWRFTPQPPYSATDLAACLRDPDTRVRIGAIRALGSFISPGLAKGRGLVRIGPLGRSGHDSVAPAVPALIAALDDPNEQVRLGAATVLGIQAAQAEDAIGPLEKRLRDPSADVRTAAGDALKWIRDGLARVHQEVAAESDRLGSADVWERVLAATNLGSYGSLARSALPQLLKALADQDAEVRRQSALALGKIGEASPTVLKALDRAAAEDRSGEVRTAAAAAAVLLRQDVSRDVSRAGVTKKSP